jgi:hypothetical protein
MTDIGDTIQAKSDQLNADDLIGGPLLITITGVQVKDNPKDEQPVFVHYQGGQGRPWKPSKGMRSLLVACWGKHSADYVGRQLLLFRNPEVQWGGKPVGGIQIAEASHIDRDVRAFLQVRKGTKAEFIVKQLRQQTQAQAQRSLPPPAEDETTADDVRGWIADCHTVAELERLWRNKAVAPFREQLQAEMEERKAILSSAPKTQGDGFDAP